MSDHIDNEIHDGDGGLISRRDALKKAAVGGAIVWSAPMILSSTANAQNVGNGVCTPKCAPPSGYAVTISARDACAGEVDELQAILGTANKIAILKVGVDLATVSCPCSEVTPLVEVYLPPGTLFYKNNGKIGNVVQYDLNPPQCVPYVANPSNNTSANYPGSPDEFLVFDSGGAVGDGWYTASNPICVSVGCPDEVGGDIVWSKCYYSLCFEYMPAGSICTISPNLKAVFGSPTDCEVGCDPCRPPETPSA